jgi:hypothetical protein
VKNSVQLNSKRGEEEVLKGTNSIHQGKDGELR